MAYEELTRRNAGYINPALQDRIRQTRLLIAGCGLGSVAAEVALRTGFESFILVDGDEVAPHNLNRQIYTHADLGSTKVVALARRLRDIHPPAIVESHATWLTTQNVASLVEKCDLIFDTIDFLDLPAVVDLHDESGRQGKTVISAFACAWGTVSVIFQPEGFTLRQLFGLPVSGPLDNATYPAVFRDGLVRLATQLPPEFLAVTHEAMQGMVEGKPCPAPQLAAGSFSAASLMVTQAVRLLARQPVTTAPQLVHLDLAQAARITGLRMQ